MGFRAADVNERRMSNDEVLASLGAALCDERSVMARIVMVLVEVASRRLFLQVGCGTINTDCVEFGLPFNGSHLVSPKHVISSPSLFQILIPSE